MNLAKKIATLCVSLAFTACSSIPEDKPATKEGYKQVSPSEVIKKYPSMGSCRAIDGYANPTNSLLTIPPQIVCTK